MCTVRETLAKNDSQFTKLLIIHSTNYSSIMSCPTSQSDASYITRFVSISVAIVSNVVASIFLYYKLYKDPESPQRAKKLDPYIIYGTFTYIVLASVTVLYNLLYRFIIESTKSTCMASDIMDEYLIVFSRTFLLLFFTYRVEQVFKQSSYAFNVKKMLIFRIFIICESFIVNTVWIAIIEMKLCVIESNFGVYCKNSGNLGAILTHFLFESSFYLIILGMFVRQLTVVTKSIQGAISNSNKSSVASSSPTGTRASQSIQSSIGVSKDESQITSTSPSVSGDELQVGTGKENSNIDRKKKNKNKNKTKNKKKSSMGSKKTNSYKLIAVALRQIIFVFISILSTWIFYLASLIDSSSVYGVFRWFYPLDWTVNVWCIVLMFKFVQFGETFGSICGCCLEFYRCPFLPQVWKDALYYYSQQHKRSSLGGQGGAGGSGNYDNIVGTIKNKLRVSNIHINIHRKSASKDGADGAGGADGPGENKHEVKNDETDKNQHEVKTESQENSKESKQENIPEISPNSDEKSKDNENETKKDDDRQVKANLKVESPSVDEMASVEPSLKLGNVESVDVRDAFAEKSWKHHKNRHGHKSGETSYID